MTENDSFAKYLTSVDEARVVIVCPPERKMSACYSV